MLQNEKPGEETGPVGRSGLDMWPAEPTVQVAVFWLRPRSSHSPHSALYPAILGKESNNK